MRGVVLACVAIFVWPLAGAAELWHCAMTRDGEALDVRFSLDAAQFAPAQALGEPPRRAVAKVDLGARRLVAEAIAMPGGYRGFHTDVPPDVPLMLMAGPDGAATLSEGDLRWSGRCEVAQ